MGGGKETPRQKMIGLMYLVLMALLAINTSKEVIESFVRIDEKLNVSKETGYSNIGSIRNSIEAKLATIGKEDKGNKTNFDWKRRADDVNTKTVELINFIEEVKGQVFGVTEGLDPNAVVSKDAGDLYKMVALNTAQKKDDYDKPTSVMGLEDPTKPKEEAFHAATLQKKIIAWKDEVIKKLKEDPNVNDGPAREQLIANLNSTFAFEDQIENEVKMSWMSYNFYHATLAASISMLTSLQVDLINMETSVIKFFHDQVGGLDFKVNKIEPSILSNSFYVIRGDSIRGQLVMAAYDTTDRPEAFFGEYDSISPTEFKPKDPYLTLTNGKKDFSIPTNQSGTKVIKGLLKTKDGAGKEKFFPFTTSYTVAEPQATIAATGMNVFYKGVTNPLEVSAAGISADKLSVQASGVTLVKKGDGKFEVKPGKGAPKKVTVTVFAEIDGKKQKMATQEYRIMNVPPAMPMTNTGVQATTPTATAAQIRGAGTLIAKIDGFLLDEKYAPRAKITKFEVTVFKGSKTFTFRSNSNKFTSEMQTAFRDLAKGDRVVFQNIQSQIPGQAAKPVASIAVKIR